MIQWPLSFDFRLRIWEILVTFSREKTQSIKNSETAQSRKDDVVKMITSSCAQRGPRKNDSVAGDTTNGVQTTTAQWCSAARQTAMECQIAQCYILGSEGLQIRGLKFQWRLIPKTTEDSRHGPRLQALLSRRFFRGNQAELAKIGFRKRGGVQKSMGNKVPWKIGADLSPCNFATAHFPAEISSFITLFLRDHPFDSLHSEFLSHFIFATYETDSQPPMGGSTLSRRHTVLASKILASYSVTCDGTQSAIGADSKSPVMICFPVIGLVAERRWSDRTLGRLLCTQSTVEMLHFHWIKAFLFSQKARLALRAFCSQYLVDHPWIFWTPVPRWCAKSHLCMLEKSLNCSAAPSVT